MGVTWLVGCLSGELYWVVILGGAVFGWEIDSILIITTLSKLIA
jgi:hypothetical protein